MHNPNPRSHLRRFALGAVALAASGLLAACGSSSSSSTTTSASSTSATASRSAFVKCLQQHGVNPPAGLANGDTPRTHSGTPPAGGGFASSPSRQAAFKACGATGRHVNGG